MQRDIEMAEREAELRLTLTLPSRFEAGVGQGQCNSLSVKTYTTLERNKTTLATFCSILNFGKGTLLKTKLC